MFAFIIKFLVACEREMFRKLFNKFSCEKLFSALCRETFHQENVLVFLKQTQEQNVSKPGLSEIFLIACNVLMDLFIKCNKVH